MTKKTALTLNEINALDFDSKRLRRRILEVAGKKGGHFGGSFSCIDTLLFIYRHVLTLDKNDPRFEARDRLIMSKGHSVLALYAVLEDLELLQNNELDEYLELDSRLAGHAEHFHIPWIEMSTGSLGHGASSGVGMALASKIKGTKWNVYVLVGDGELNEGSNWEAFMFAAQHNLSNFTLLVDNNGMESLARTDEIMRVEPLEEKLISFGFSVFSCDGHNFHDISRAFLAIEASLENKPKCVILNTNKGHGVSFMSGNPMWHYRELKQNEREIAMKELTP